jgi:hypothetical protein
MFITVSHFLIVIYWNQNDLDGIFAGTKLSTAVARGSPLRRRVRSGGCPTRTDKSYIFVGE